MFIAQTNLQLYNQLLSSGYSNDDLSEIKHGYDFATRLFTCKYRASGKPFLAHLVGTASLMAWMRQPICLVSAALNHAAFDSGDFNDSGIGATYTRVRTMRRALSASATDLVVAYHRASRLQILRSVDESPLDSDGELDAATLGKVQLMIACDTIEELSDSAMNYAPRKNDWLVDRCDRNVRLKCLCVLRSLGLDIYADEVERALQTWDDLLVPDELRTPFSGSYDVPPQSFTKSAKSMFFARVRKLRARLNRHLTNRTA